WKAINPDADEEPDDAALAPIVDERTDAIRQFVTPLIDTSALDRSQDGEGPVTAGQVVVSMYYDFDSAFGPTSDGAIQAGDGGWIWVGTGRLGASLPTIGLG